MGKVVTRDQPCLDSTCGSSDARQIYEDGSSYCFSCQKWFGKDKKPDAAQISVGKKPKNKSGFERMLTPEEIKQLPVRGLPNRDITKKVTEFFDVKISYGQDGQIDAHFYPYGGDSYKKRSLPKDFSWIEKTDGLFGREKFNGAGRRLIICEGEIDALSIAQASMDKYGKIYPVVALSSSAMAHKSCLKERDWIRSFKEVVLCFDEDEAGDKARKEAITVIGVDKVKIAKLPLNDANKVLTEEDGNVLLSCIFDAAPYIPTGIMTKEKLWEALEVYNQTESHPYPPCLHGLNTKLKGKRGGEITLFISGTGAGKSTMLRECMLADLENPNKKIGVVSLEESPAETARKLCGMILGRNPAEEEIPLEEMKPAFDQIFGEDRVIILDHQGAMNDTSIGDQLEYMALSKCTDLYVDHITILVSEGVDNLVGNEAQDKVMNDLLKLVKRHPDVWVGLVSHLRKAPVGGKSFEEGKLPNIDDIRGSGSIKQVSFDIVSFARDTTHKDEKVRNRMKMRVLKSRFTGLTGEVPGADYIYDTGRLKYAEGELVTEDDDEFTKL